MFGKDFWRILRLIYVILKALIEMDPPTGGKLDDLSKSGK